MLQKYHSDDLPNFCAVYEAENADNTRTFGIWFYDKSSMGESGGILVSYL